MIVSPTPESVVARHDREVQRQYGGMGIGHDVRHPGPAEHVDIIRHVPECGNPVARRCRAGRSSARSMVALLTPGALISTRPKSRCCEWVAVSVSPTTALHGVQQVVRRERSTLHQHLDELLVVRDLLGRGR